MFLAVFYLLIRCMYVFCVLKIFTENKCNWIFSGNIYILSFGAYMNLLRESAATRQRRKKSGNSRSNKRKRKLCTENDTPFVRKSKLLLKRIHLNLFDIQEVHTTHGLTPSTLSKRDDIKISNFLEGFQFFSCGLTAASIVVVCRWC